MQVKVLSTRVNKKKKPASKTLLNLIIYVEELVILFISSALQYHLVAIADSCIFKSLVVSVFMRDDANRIKMYSDVSIDKV